MQRSGRNMVWALDREAIGLHGARLLIPYLPCIGVQSWQEWENRLSFTPFAEDCLILAVRHAQNASTLPTCRGSTSNPTRQKLRSIPSPQRPRTPEPNSAAPNSNSGSGSPRSGHRFWLKNCSKMVADTQKSTMVYFADFEKAPSARKSNYLCAEN